MFDSLAEKLQGTLADVRQRGTLTEADVNSAMREIRLALLEADVNFKVVHEFTNAVKERCLGADVIGKLNPGQQVVKIVSEELTALMGGAAPRASASPRGRPDRDPDGRPAGLGQDDRHGEAGPLPARGARAPRSRSRRAMSTGPAAVEQLVKVGRAGGCRGLRAGHRPRPGRDRASGRSSAREHEGKDVLIVDTSGRLHVDEELMAELVRIREAGQAARHPARGRRDDRPGRGQRRRAASPQAVRLRRRRHDQARRRRPRRRRAVGQGRHRQADPVRVAPARSSTSSSASTRTAWRSGSSAWATCMTLIEKARAPVRRGRRAGARAQAAPQRIRARRLPRPAARRSAGWARSRACSG